MVQLLMALSLGGFSAQSQEDISESVPSNRYIFVGSGRGMRANTVFEGLSFVAVIEGWSPKEGFVGDPKLLYFDLKHRRPRGNMFPDFHFGIGDVVSFGLGHALTVNETRDPARNRAEAIVIGPKWQPLGTRNATNELIARIVLYPTLNDVQFVSNPEEAVDPRSFTRLWKVVPFEKTAWDDLRLGIPFPELGPCDAMLSGHLHPEDPVTYGGNRVKTTLKRLTQKKKKR